MWLKSRLALLCTAQVVHAISHLPPGSTSPSAVDAVRALGPQYAGVTAVESGLVDVLTQHEQPSSGTEEEQEEGARGEEELAHEQLLLGREVRFVLGVRGLGSGCI